MPRRPPYTSLEKSGQARPPHVRGTGDVVFRGFQCLRDTCLEFITVREDSIGPDFAIRCPKCDFLHESEGQTGFFDYSLVHRETRDVIEEGEFFIAHADYIDDGQRLKHCLMCYAMKPLNRFDRHASRRSGRQGECRLCKTVYNRIKNQSRLPDQHREAAARRRLYNLLSGASQRVNSRDIHTRFGGQCFNCHELLPFTSSGPRGFHLDHTLPARLLWPLRTETATLLCSSCNNSKHDKWPSEFYDIPKLRRLARLTAYDYATLSGPPTVNDDAVATILSDADAFIENWIEYPKDIAAVRNLVREYANIDIFGAASYVPPHLAPNAADDGYP